MRGVRMKGVEEEAVLVRSRRARVLRWRRSVTHQMHGDAIAVA